jgi:NAD(P) transhydrogenase subunit beta
LTLVAAVSPTALRWTYLVAAVCFVIALKALSSPRTARRGLWIGIGGMTIGVVMTFADQHPGRDWLIVVGVVIGSAVGAPAARMVKMTAMPQMVAAFNGVGGAAAAVVSVGEFLHDAPTGIGTAKLIEIVFPIFVGCLSFTGSALAFAKLQEIMSGRPVLYRAQQPVNAALLLSAIALSAVTIATPHVGTVAALVVVSLVLGAAFVLPVGGADTPVLISLLNAFTGLAVAADGFVLNNFLLVVGGILVGASGALLTRMMADAMGRSLGNILFGAFGSVIEVTGAAADGAHTVRPGTPEDIATLLAYSRKVVIVPGYGLAVAQAQHVARELADLLSERGVEVSYAIHPVAGRMPGHMNVLLAEANVPYEQLREMEQVNPELPTTDVALVVGANDVVNPAARTSPNSPIYGMPIIDVDNASHVVFLKRSLRPGFAGIDNELLYNEKTTLLFGDARESLSKLVGAVKQV